MSFARTVVHLAITVLGGSIALAQGSSVDATAPGIALGYAQLSGQSDLAAAIQNGDVNILAGPMPDGVNAMAYPAPQGCGGDPTKPAIILKSGSHPAEAGAAAVHEWVHLSNNHPPVNPEDGPDAAQAFACMEAEAHCAVLQSMLAFYLETGQGVPCWVRNKVILDYANSAHVCANGPGVAGPPAIPTCGGSNPQQIPCSG